MGGKEFGSSCVHYLYGGSLFSHTSSIALFPGTQKIRIFECLGTRLTSSDACVASTVLKVIHTGVSFGSGTETNMGLGPGLYGAEGGLGYTRPSCSHKEVWLIECSPTQ